MTEFGARIWNTPVLWPRGNQPVVTTATVTGSGPLSGMSRPELVALMAKVERGIVLLDDMTVAAQILLIRYCVELSSQGALTNDRNDADSVAGSNLDALKNKYPRAAAVVLAKAGNSPLTKKAFSDAYNYYYFEILDPILYDLNLRDLVSKLLAGGEFSRSSLVTPEDSVRFEANYATWLSNQISQSPPRQGSMHTDSRVKGTINEELLVTKEAADIGSAGQLEKGWRGTDPAPQNSISNITSSRAQQMVNDKAGTGALTKQVFAGAYNEYFFNIYSAILELSIENVDIEEDIIKILGAQLDFAGIDRGGLDLTGTILASQSTTNINPIEVLPRDPLRQNTAFEQQYIKGLLALAAWMKGVKQQITQCLAQLPATPPPAQVQPKTYEVKTSPTIGVINDKMVLGVDNTFSCPFPYLMARINGLANAATGDIYSYGGEVAARTPLLFNRINLGASYGVLKEQNVNKDVDDKRNAQTASASFLVNLLPDRLWMSGKFSFLWPFDDENVTAWKAGLSYNFSRYYVEAGGQGMFKNRLSTYPSSEQRKDGAYIEFGLGGLGPNNESRAAIGGIFGQNIIGAYLRIDGILSNGGK